MAVHAAKPHNASGLWRQHGANRRFLYKPTHAARLVIAGNTTLTNRFRAAVCSQWMESEYKAKAASTARRGAWNNMDPPRQPIALALAPELAHILVYDAPFDQSPQTD